MSANHLEIQVEPAIFGNPSNNKPYFLKRQRTSDGTESWMQIENNTKTKQSKQFILLGSA